MARINKIRFAGWVVLLLSVLWLGGCTASMQARSAFEEAERYAAEERFDEAVAKYAEAVNLDPSSKNYKLQLLSTRTQAATSHAANARRLAKENKLIEAMNEYQRAREFDPNVAVVAQEERALRNILDAQKFAEEGADFFTKRNMVLARKAINRALKLDANNARALAVKDLLNRNQNSVAMDGIELDVASDEPITLSFKDANIKEVFGILSQLTGINFIFDEDIRTQSISVLLEKASFAQAMELILQMNGLDKKVLNSKTIIIYPLSKDKEKQYGDQIIQTFYLSHIDAKKAVNLLRTMLQLRKVYVHEERNALVVRDKPEVIRLAEQILSAADRENSEVVFDLELVAVSSGDELKFGPRLSSYSVSAGLSQDGTNIVSSTLGNVTEGLVKNMENLEAFYTLPTAAFDFAKTLSGSEILASPKIRVRNKEKAKVHIGTREPVITVTQNGDNYSDSVQYVDVGVKLDVEPNIQLDKSVETKLKLEVSQKIAEGETDRGTRYLTISTTNAETVLTLQDGVQTIIGGLFEQQDTSSRKTVAFLGDIPLIGSLFTNYDNKDLKREILLSITPYIIRSVEVPELDVATIWSGGEDNLKNGPNFGAFSEPLMSEIDVIKPLAAPAVQPLDTGVNVPAESPAENVTSPPEVMAPGGEVKPEQVTQEQITEIEALLEEEPPVAEEDVLLGEPSGEVVPAEIMPEQAKIEPPIVLELPTKTPTLGFSGPAQVEVGKEFSVAVEVKDVEKLYSAPLFVSFDPAILELVNISEGTFLKQDGQSTVFSNSPNRTTGQVIVGYKQGTGGQGVSGSGILFNLNFKPIDVGETGLEINRVNFRNSEGVRLQVEPEAFSVEVR